MNILIPHSWLKDYLETSASPEKIAECLSLAGPSVEKLNRLKDDWVYEIEITSNRVDMMSVVGIAKEAAVILNQFGLAAKFKNDPYKLYLNSKIYNSKSVSLSQAKKLTIIIKNKNLCSRFTAVVLENIKIKTSPKIIQERLEKSGIRSLNNVVDVSNYLMRAFGQPVHIFDFDQILEQKMILRLSKAGETITTLDGKNFNLSGNDIVIEDGKGRLIDLCGIMGAQNSAVSSTTKNILLFVQTYNPYFIRQTAMKLAQHTQASQLFEKGTDPELVMPTLIKGVELLSQLAQGKVASKIYDIYPKPYQSRFLLMPFSIIEEKLGIKIQPQKVLKILNSLGLTSQILSNKTQQLKIKIPSWRANDINLPEDVVEEVARIYGYHRLPSQLPIGALPQPSPWNKILYWEKRIKRWLVGWGLTEVYTYPFTPAQAGALKLKNPLSTEWQTLRLSLISALKEVVKKNLKFKKEVKIFEVAHIYLPCGHQLPKEKLTLAIIWMPSKFTSLKGVLEALFQNLAIKVEFKPEAEKVEILTHKEKIGYLSSFSNESLKGHFAELNLEMLIEKAGWPKISTSLPKYPALVEDLTFVFLKPILYADLVSLVKKETPLVTKIEFLNQYQNKKTFRFYYQHPQKSLSNKEIAPLRKKIIEKLEEKGLKLIGKI